MNVKNNRRKRESVEKIEKAFINLIQTKELHTVTVAEICKAAGLNRSTFYANYTDVYALADKLREKLEAEFNGLFMEPPERPSEYDAAVKMFRHISENQLFYKTYFRLGYHNMHQNLIYNQEQAEQYFSDRHINYHIEFFRTGLNAVIKMWLEGGCRETPEEIAGIIASEYQGRK